MTGTREHFWVMKSYPHRTSANHLATSNVLHITTRLSNIKQSQKKKLFGFEVFSCNYAVLVAEKWQPGRKNCVSWWAQVIPHRGTVLGNKMNILLLLPSLYQREQQRVTTPPPYLMDQWYPSKSIQHLSFCSVHLLFCVGHLVDWFGWSRSKNWSSWWVWDSHNVRPSVLPFLPRLPCGPYFLSEATLWA